MFPASRMEFANDQHSLLAVAGPKGPRGFDGSSGCGISLRDTEVLLRRAGEGR